MLRSYRLLVTAVCGIIVVVCLGTGAYFGALNAPHYGYQSEHPAYRAAHSKERNPSQIDRDRAGLPYFAERIASGSDPEKANERENRDLAAQESTSVWAFWMLLVSVVSVAVTMIGTGFLLWQIILTREAVVDTGNATRAMQRQNDLAEQAQRPFVNVAEIRGSHGTKAIVELPSDYWYYEINLQVAFMNIGVSIAYVEELRVHASQRANPSRGLSGATVTIPQRPLMRPGKKEDINWVEGGGGVGATYQPQAGAIGNETVVRCAAIYRDILGTRWRTKSAFLYMGEDKIIPYGGKDEWYDERLPVGTAYDDTPHHEGG